MQIIPIAGEGTRFANANYTVAKYLLPFEGLPIIEHILEHFEKSVETLVVLNAKKNHIEIINAILKKLSFVNYEVVEISNTDGQLMSVLEGLAISTFRNFDKPTWIFNGDTIRYDKIPYKIFDEFPDFDAFIEVFHQKGEHWSFVDSLGNVKLVAEKVRISDYACSGLYGFRNIQVLRKLYLEGAISKVRNESYVSSAFNTYIAKNRSVYSFLTDRSKFKLCGTPEEYESVVKK
jgi:dTDP-glucose pyrophosphorylase